MKRKMALFDRLKIAKHLKEQMSGVDSRIWRIDREQEEQVIDEAKKSSGNDLFRKGKLEITRLWSVALNKGDVFLY